MHIEPLEFLYLLLTQPPPPPKKKEIKYQTQYCEVDLPNLQFIINRSELESHYLKVKQPFMGSSLKLGTPGQGKTIKPDWQSQSEWLSCYRSGKYLQILPEETKTISAQF